MMIVMSVMCIVPIRQNCMCSPPPSCMVEFRFQSPLQLVFISALLFTKGRERDAGPHTMLVARGSRGVPVGSAKGVEEAARLRGGCGGVHEPAWSFSEGMQ